MFNSTPWCDENAVRRKSSNNLFRAEEAIGCYLFQIDPVLLVCQRGVADRRGVCAAGLSRPINRAVCLSCPPAVLEESIRTRPALPAARLSAPLHLFALFVGEKSRRGRRDEGYREEQEQND